MSMTTAESSKAGRARYRGRGMCINGCGRPWVLLCGLCRACADKRAANAKAWRSRKAMEN